MQENEYKEVLQGLVGVLRRMEACPACDVPDSMTDVEKRAAGAYTIQMVENMEREYTAFMARATKLLGLR